MKARQSSSAPVGVLTKVLAIFELLDRSPNGLSLREIAEQSNINRTTAYRFLAHLEKVGYLVRDDGGAYLVGPRLVRLGSGSAYQSTIRSVSRSTLKHLWQESGETVNLGVRDGLEVIYLDVIESPHNFRLVSEVGMRRSLHCTGLGKAILAGQPDQLRDELLASMNFEKYTPHTITRSSALSAELRRIQARGYALDNEEAVLGACCVAAPIFDSSGYAVGGISISGPVTRMNHSRAEKISVALKAAAAEISALLGHPAPIAIATH